MIFKDAPEVSVLDYLDYDFRIESRSSHQILIGKITKRYIISNTRK